MGRRKYRRAPRAGRIQHQPRNGYRAEPGTFSMSQDGRRFTRKLLSPDAKTAAARPAFRMGNSRNGTASGERDLLPSAAPEDERDSSRRACSLSPRGKTASPSPPALPGGTDDISTRDQGEIYAAAMPAQRRKKLRSGEVPPSCPFPPVPVFCRLCHVPQSFLPGYRQDFIPDSGIPSSAHGMQAGRPSASMRILVSMTFSPQREHRRDLLIRAHSGMGSLGSPT